MMWSKKQKPAPAPGKIKALPGMPVLPPLNAFIELIVFFAVVLFFDAVLQFFPDLNEIKPHPFWFPVLLLSLQYGTVSGLLAAGVSILITTILGWPEQDVGENHFNFLIRIWAEPVLWIVVALVLGQFRMRQIAQRRALLRKVNRLQTQRDAIEQHSTNLRGRCEMLERRIASQQANTPRVVLDAIAQLDGAGADQLQKAFSKSMQLAFGPGQYSVFALHDREFSLIAYHGWEGDLAWRRRFTSDDPLTQRLLSDDAGVTILRKSDVDLLNGQGFAAVPILSSAVVIGMLKVEYTEPDQMDKAMLDRLNVIGTQLAGAVLAHSGAAPLAAQNNPTLQLRRGRKTNWRHLRWDARTSKHLADEQIQGRIEGVQQMPQPASTDRDTGGSEDANKPRQPVLKKPKVIR